MNTVMKLGMTVLAFSLTGAGVCHAQDYPNRAVRMVVPFSPERGAYHGHDHG